MVDRSRGLPAVPRLVDFLPSGLYRRHRNYTGSIPRRGVAGFTAGQESRSANGRRSPYPENLTKTYSRDRRRVKCAAPFLDWPYAALYSPSMIGFLIKKTFFDLWDNMFRIALINIGFIASVAIALLVPTLFQTLPALGLAIGVVGLLWCFVYAGAAALCLRSISDYGSFGFADFFAALKESWASGLLLGVIFALLILFGWAGLPFYLGMNSLLGVFAAALVFWTLLIAFLALQFYLPIRARLDTDFRKILKKSFLIFFDNPALAIFSAIHNLVLMALSTFLAFLIPGPAGALLFLDEAFRLRLLKYDWLEEHPDANRRKIPWDLLLEEEREKTGSRSFRSFIFPWKD